jgi:putative Ca2+/H+ antiporter (TMEM165/GDT1 family)
MDAFLLALILSFLIALGGREQLIVAQFAESLARSLPLLFAGAACAVLTAAIMAYAGASLAALLPRRAAEMLVAFALVIAAVELAWPVRLKEMKEPTRSVVAIAVVLAFRQVGDAARFAVFAIAAWAHYPTMAFAGGAIGGVAAVALGWSLGLGALRSLPLRFIRLALAACTIVAGVVIGLNARFAFL